MTEVKKQNETEKKIRIKEFKKSIGDGQFIVQYSCGGFHLDESDSAHLPARGAITQRGRVTTKTIRKIEPGVVYSLPASIAMKYLKSNSALLEEVYD